MSELHDAEMRPMISIVMPVYNAASTLVRAIESIRNQTISMRLIEAIAVDDGSTDDSARTLAEMCRELRFLRTASIAPHVRGAGRARNMGIDMARGEYVMFIDADDEYLPEACETFLSAIHETDNQMVSSEYLVTNGRRETYPALFRHPALHNVTSVCPVSVPPLFWLAPAIWSRIFRRSFLLDHRIRFPEQTVNDDALFVTESLLRADLVSHIAVPTYRYHRDSDPARPTVTEWFDEQYLADFLRIRRALIALYDEQDRVSYHPLRSGLDAQFLMGRVSSFISHPVSAHMRALLTEIFGLLVPDESPVLSDTEQLMVELARAGMIDELVDFAALLRESANAGGKR